MEEKQGERKKTKKNGRKTLGKEENKEEWKKSKVKGRN